MMSSTIRKRRGYLARCIAEYRADFIFLSAIALFLTFFSLAFAEQLAYDSGGRRDPMIPLIGPGGTLTLKADAGADLKIEGIIYDPPNGSLVLMRGDFYKQGDKVGDSTVMSILKDRVIFMQSDEEKIIWLQEEIIKPKAQSKEIAHPAPRHQEKPKA